MLAGHQFWHANQASIGSNAHCLCGYRPIGFTAWQKHTSQALAEALFPDRETMDGDGQ